MCSGIFFLSTAVHENELMLLIRVLRYKPCLMCTHTYTSIGLKIRSMIVVGSPLAPSLTTMKVTRLQSPQLSLSMGPVSAAVLVYVTKRFLSRLMAGQILRKGVSRKIRRLTHMILDYEILVEIMKDFLEDIVYFTSM